MKLHIEDNLLSNCIRLRVRFNKQSKYARQKLSGVIRFTQGYSIAVILVQKFELNGLQVKALFKNISFGGRYPLTYSHYLKYQGIVVVMSLKIHL